MTDLEREAEIRKSVMHAAKRMFPGRRIGRQEIEAAANRMIPEYLEWTIGQTIGGEIQLFITLERVDLPKPETHGL